MPNADSCYVVNHRVPNFLFGKGTMNPVISSTPRRGWEKPIQLRSLARGRQRHCPENLKSVIKLSKGLSAFSYYHELAVLCKVHRVDATIPSVPIPFGIPRIRMTLPLRIF